MTKFLDDFKSFILQGNVVEMIVGFTVGVAFKDAVSSFVDNIIMPPIASVMSSTSFEQLYFSLNGDSYDSLETARAANAPVIMYGQFLADIIDLLIIALAVYVTIKLFQRFGLFEEEKNKK